MDRQGPREELDVSTDADTGRVARADAVLADGTSLGSGEVLRTAALSQAASRPACAGGACWCLGGDRMQGRPGGEKGGQERCPCQREGEGEPCTASSTALQGAGARGHLGHRNPEKDQAVRGDSPWSASRTPRVVRDSVPCQLGLKIKR